MFATYSYFLTFSFTASVSGMTLINLISKQENKINEYINLCKIEKKTRKHTRAHREDE